MKKKRFVPLKNHKGIRKDVVTGKYVARKYVDGKEYSESFSLISKAENWRRNFHPLLTNTEINKGASTDLQSLDDLCRVQSRPNGVDQRFTFAQAWELYKKQYFPTLEQQTIDDRLKFAKYFFPELMPLKMIEINAELIDAFMEKKAADARSLGNPRRKNFDNDLKCLKAFLNWYKENYDSMFVVPILKRHYAIGVIKKEVKTRSRKMTLEEVTSFLNSFESDFWRDFAEFQFYMAARGQEVAGLQWSSVNWEKGFVQVSDVAIWGESKRFIRLKEVPKNGEERIVYLNKPMREILERRFSQKSGVPCEFVRESNGEKLEFIFERDGQPVSYRSIQYQYNRALKKAGLYGVFRSTHILRKAMANIVRQEMGLDAAQAAGGWKSRDVVEKTYTDAPRALNKKAVDYVERMASGLKLVKVSSHTGQNDKVAG